MDLLASGAVIGFVIFLWIGAIRDIHRTKPRPAGWCSKTQQVCPLLRDEADREAPPGVSETEG